MSERPCWIGQTLTGGRGILPLHIALTLNVQLCLGCHSPSHTASTRPAEAQTVVAPTVPKFPTDWLGNWKGPSTNTNPDGRSMAFGMELRIAPIPGSERFTWEITYIDSKGARQVRPYELVTINAAKGQYQIDEKSSIKIDSYLIDGVLYSQFAVMNTMIADSYRIENGRMIVELVSIDPAHPIASGGENGVPQVNSHPVTSVQRAVLTRD